MKTDALIAELTLNSKAVNRLGFKRICAEWLIVTFASLGIITWLYDLRADISVQFADPLFLYEMILSALLIIVSGLAATSLAYPDRAKITILKPLLITVFAGYSLLILTTVSQTPELSNSLESSRSHGLECMLCILSYAALPALWMLWRLRQLANIKPEITGLAALMMAAATGSLGVRLVESEIVPTGLILWHYLPLLAISATGLWLGKKILKW